MDVKSVLFLIGAFGIGYYIGKKQTTAPPVTLPLVNTTPLAPGEVQVTVMPEIAPGTVMTPGTVANPPVDTRNVVVLRGA
jgi:hypothetical protein